MKDHPILFSAPMVRAILDDRKTATRRLNGLKLINEHPDWYTKAVRLCDGTWSFYDPAGMVDDEFVRRFHLKGGGFKCPWRKGDRLWVRETWTLGKVEACGDGSDEGWCVGDGSDVLYREDIERNGIGTEGVKWRPSIFMPRHASRITLELTEDPVPQRLQEMTEEGARAEGIEKSGVAGPWKIYDDTSFLGTTNPIRSFASLWNSIHGPGAWERNPWVWVLRFRRVKP